MIDFCKHTQTFWLSTKKSDYIFKVTEFGYLRTLHVGGKVGTNNLDYLIRDVDRGFSAAITENDNRDRTKSLATMPNEFPISGNGDFRQGSLLVTDATGNRLHDLKFFDYEIPSKKPTLSVLPQMRDGETLVITLKSAKLTAKLFYTVYEEQDAITRRVEITNDDKQPMDISRIMSLSLDLPDAAFDIGMLHGRHLQECSFERQSARHGITAAQNFRGGTNHQCNPFLCAMRKNADETQGEVFGFNLIYGGNFLCQAEVDQVDTLRVQLGINPYDFQYTIAADETFSSPECVMTYSDCGIGGMSRNFHDLYRNYLIPKRFANTTRPIVINNWEATYFEFDQQKLFEMIDNCRGMGIDTFVLDDGWFGMRNDDTTGLGDWFVNTKKLEGGLKPIIERCKKNGMKFGLWFEPEMISEDSDLYRAHPDYCIHVDGIVPTRSRDQLVLDMTRKQVQEYIVNAVSDILRTYDISYVKWDFNRSITDTYSPDLCHKFMLAFYQTAKRLTNAFPHILFEGCCGGGGRFDPAMLAYFPQVWTSDCTDAYERTKIQYGTSLCYPLSSMSSHVSACPNHQTHRNTPLQSRIDIACSTAFGYELNPNIFTEQERAQIAQANARYQKLAPILMGGDLYRIESTFNGNAFSQIIVSKDKRQAFFVRLHALSVPNAPIKRVKLQGLDDNLVYRIEELAIDVDGLTLRNAGLSANPDVGDFTTEFYTLTAI